MNLTESELQSFLDDYSIVFGVILFFVVVDAILKLITLWQSARRKQIVWFIFLALVNSLGILPVIYLLINKNKAKFRP